jgi:dTDP-4-dehydrorhamnose 3,5-epimerase
VQGNLSRSRPGVLRGLHYHRIQADLWVPVDGQATVGLVDLREDSPTNRDHLAIDVEPGIALYLPPGVAHGFCARTAFTLLYLVDRAYDGADEFGFSPLDPAAGITWPVDEPVLSDRDRQAPTLAEALAAAPVGRSAG